MPPRPTPRLPIMGAAIVALLTTLSASCSSSPAEPGGSGTTRTRDAGGASSGGAAASSSSGAARTCVEDADCVGDPGACKRWSCNTEEDRCVAQSLGERCNTCGSGAALRVHFYDVSQGLAALIDLPDGRHILVDTGDTPNRQYCGGACQAAHDHLMAELNRELAGAPLDLLWISHPHSDHIGGASNLLDLFEVHHYVDNGRDGGEAQIANVHRKAAAQASMSVIEPGREQLPIAGSGDLVLTAIAPSVWLPVCSSDRNACSIVLRIDYCDSSVLFVGDAGAEEEALLDTRGPATLLQIGHHGSDTSSSAEFLAAVQPKYAVVSSAKQNQGINGSYCHPRASTMAAVTAALGGPGSQTLRAFDGQVSCRDDTDAHWVDVPVSDGLWATARDGDVVLSTTGDGLFVRQ